MDSLNGVNPLLNAGSIPKNNDRLGQKDFLKLMLAQFRNQDPTNPKTNGDFLAQLAQFSTNDGITKMQESLQQLAGSLQSNQALQASSLVGRKVLINSNVAQLAGDGGVKINVETPAPVNNLTAFIYSSAGELVRKIPLGQHNTGMFDFTWDGMSDKGEKLAPGNYIVGVNGLYGDQEVALKTMMAANVDSVSLGFNGEGVRLNVAGIGEVPLEQVKQISQ